MTKCKECDTFQERLKRGQLCNECYNAANPEVIRRNGASPTDPPGDIAPDGDYWTKLGALLDGKVKKIEDKLDIAVGGLNDKIKTLQTKCEKYEEDIDVLKSIVVTQQRCLSQLDSSERECNLIISGLDEKDITHEGATYTDDKSKLTALFGVMSAALPDEAVSNRLGKPDPSYKRKIKVKMPNKVTRDAILRKTKELKEAAEPWKHVYVQSDKHPVVLQEEARLRNKRKTLKSLDENKDKDISIVKGKLMVNAEEVDRNMFFR